MKYFSYCEKVFIISMLCVVLKSSSAAESDDKKDDTMMVRNKRFNARSLAQWGTNWCLDQRTDADDKISVGLFFQSDECCQKHVKCTKKEKEDLLKLYPDMTNEIEKETFRSCVCDEEFSDCLHEVEGILFKARKIGKYYFNNLARTCRDVELKKVDNLVFDM